MIKAIFQDTREQTGKHSHVVDELEARDYKVIRHCLYFGDYAFVDNILTAVDTKQNYRELASNICGREHGRFRRECERAKELGGRLIVLVEQDCGPEEWLPRTSGLHECQVEPEALAKAMDTMTIKYGVRFEHCDKKDTAFKILRLLREGA